MTIRLDWINNNVIDEGVNVYRSTTPFGDMSLETPIAVLPRGTVQYIDSDETLVEGNTYYYRVSAFIGSNEEFSLEVAHENILNIGPGPTELIAGDMNAGFFGETLSTDLVDGTTLASHIGLTAGTEVDPNVNWLKFAFNGKILYTPLKALRQNVAWDAIYASGAVYGDGTDGFFPIGTPVTQDASITVGSHTFSIRLFQGMDNDPTTWENSDISQPVDNPGNALNSEWSVLMHKIADGTWASYSSTDLFLSNGGHTWCKETSIDNNSLRVLQGVSNITQSYLRTATSGSFRGWRPVLELL